jgi:hypothetical protein
MKLNELEEAAMDAINACADCESATPVERKEVLDTLYAHLTIVRSFPPQRRLTMDQVYNRLGRTAEGRR